MSIVYIDSLHLFFLPPPLNPLLGLSMTAPSSIIPSSLMPATAACSTSISPLKNTQPSKAPPPPPKPMWP